MHEDVSHPSAGVEPHIPKTHPLIKKPEQVARSLRNRIVRGEIKEGDFLPAEAELVTQFGVSRPTIREAMRILESESLLTITNGSRRGPRVHRPNPDIAAKHFGLVLQGSDTTVADIYRARMLCEPIVARLLASEKRFTAPPVLNAIIQEALEHIFDDEAFVSAEVRFHETLFELSGNKTLTLLMRLLHSVFERHMRAVMALDPVDAETERLRKKPIKAQQQLVRLIEAGDAHGAEAYWTVHLRRVAEVMLEGRDAERVIDVLE